MRQEQRIIIGSESDKAVQDLLNEAHYDRIFTLCDENTRKFCFPLLSDMAIPTISITVSAGESHKNVTILSTIWQQLCDGGATRHSLLINIGGGVITDMGGFAAATFKRGIDYWNVPTTLLSMVDASVGGKTAIDFNGLKNEIGAFHSPIHVLIDTRFLQTLDSANILSGYAEMLKHGLLDNEKHLSELLSYKLSSPDLLLLQDMIERSIHIKGEIVQQDPFEKGIRQALNLGHTFGHAFESLALEQGRPIPHGYAVAYGLVCELYLSHQRKGFPVDKLRKLQQFIRSNYGEFAFDCKQYERIFALITHDKKNSAGSIHTTLLSDIGGICINEEVTRKEIEDTLDFYTNN